jgi:hypothetical protein
MPYTLKVDWTGNRAQAVIDVLRAWPPLTWQLKLYVDPGRMSEISTIKLNWTPEQLHLAVTLLTEWLKRSDRLALRARDGDGSYEDVVAMQAQVHAALRDIYDYQEGLEAATDAR